MNLPSDSETRYTTHNDLKRQEMMAVSYVNYQLVGVGEELLFRGVVQRSFYNLFLRGCPRNGHVGPPLWPAQECLDWPIMEKVGQPFLQLRLWEECIWAGSITTVMDPLTSPPPLHSTLGGTLFW